jgi:hypothetical protein
VVASSVVRSTLSISIGRRELWLDYWRAVVDLHGIRATAVLRWCAGAWVIAVGRIDRYCSVKDSVTTEALTIVFNTSKIVTRIRAGCDTLFD